MLITRKAGLFSFHGIPVLMVKQTDSEDRGMSTNTDKMGNKLLMGTQLLQMTVQIIGPTGLRTY